MGGLKRNNQKNNRGSIDSSMFALGSPLSRVRFKSNNDCSTSQFLLATVQLRKVSLKEVNER